MTLLLCLALQAADFDALAEKFQAERGLLPPQRKATIDALGALKTDAAGGLLVKGYSTEEEDDHRALYLPALAANGSEIAVALLQSVVGNREADMALRAGALRGLMTEKHPQGLVLARTCVRRNDDLRVETYLNLHHYPVDDTEKLWRAALDDPNPSLRGRALAMLAPLKDRPLITRAQKLLKDPDEEAFVKYGAVIVCREAGGLQVTKTLIEAAAADDLTLRRLIADALGSFKDKSSIRAVGDVLRHRDPRVRYVAVLALGTLDEPRAMTRLYGALKDRDVTVRVAALEAVARRRDEKSATTLIREAKKSNPDTAAVAMDYLVHYPTPETVEALSDLAGSYKPEVAIPALDALSAIGTPDALPAFEQALKSGKWPIRVSAIRGLGKLKKKASIDLLVGRMPSEEGRMLAEVGQALRGLTGKSIGYAAGAWKAWWEANRETFSFDAAATEARAGGPGMTTYYGVPVMSDRVVFCVDISGSMSAEVEGDETRLDQAKKELSRVLSALGDEARVNLLFFDDRIEPWSRRLTPIKSNLKRALATISALEPRGTTNIFDTLDGAFQHSDVDTVYLLSDGDPTDGRIVEPGAILREIRRMNRLRQIIIHTISFGPSPFLKELAAQNGGEYVEVN